MNSAKKRAVLIFATTFVGLGLALYFAGCSSNPGPYQRAELRDQSKLRDFMSGIRPASGNPHSHYLLGRYYQDSGQHKEAAEEYIKVLSIDPRHVEAYNALGICYDLLGKFPEAAEAYRAALRLDPKLDCLHNNLGYSLFLQGDLDGAVVAFREAITLNGREARFHNNLGLAYGEKSEFDLAFAEFKLAGDESKAHYNLAQLYFRKGLYKQAKEHYAKALALNPSSALARTALEATGALASIFQPMKKADVDALAGSEVIERTHIRPAEAGNPVGSEPREANQETSTASSRKAAETEFAPAALKKQSLSLAWSESRREPGESREVFAGGAEGRKEEGKHAGAAPSPRDESGMWYEVRVASFSSYKLALSELGDLQKSGFSANLTNWTDRKGKKWHTISVGPWATREEALGCKSRLERGGRYKSVIQPNVVHENEGTLSAQNKNCGEKTLNRQLEAGIEISNGNGVNGMAARVRTLLIQKGLKVVRLTNADDFKHSRTSIFYQRGFYYEAGRVAEHFPGAEKMEEVQKFDRPRVKIKVVIGKELVSHGALFGGGQRS